MTDIVDRPALLFYCQHSLGMGHLVRSLALAGGLAARFRVVFLNGGPLPAGARIPAGVEIVDLPPLGSDPDGRLLSRDPRYTLEQAQQARRERMLAIFEELRPEVVLIELFPFGRKKFKNELMPLLDAAHALGDARPLILCSLRDILVGRPNQQRHDERASELANRYFDAILVHADPRFARLEESFQPGVLLRIPVHYTGFVLAGAALEHRSSISHDPRSHAKEREDLDPYSRIFAWLRGFLSGALELGAQRERSRQVIVSAGGGLVGGPLLHAAAGAHALLWPAEGVRMKLIAGPFLPDQEWEALCAAVYGQPGLQLLRFVPDLAGELRAAAASISQCGYNTAMEIVQAGVPALVVPYGEGQEDEQMRRARRLERLGALRVLDPRQLDARNLAAAIRALLDFRPRTIELDLDGARHTAELVATLVRVPSAQVGIEA